MDVTPIGRFVALEGPDGAGKSRAAAHLADRIRARGRTVTLTREPGGTRLGEQIRAILLDTGSVARGAEADALLFNAARAQLVREVIRPALQRGDVVISDRFGGSTLAYQGYGGGVDLASLRLVEAFAVDGARPDLVILLDVPVEVGLARRLGGDPAELTRYEDADVHGSAFHERVRRGYLALADADREHWRVVDGTRSPDDVDEQLFRVLDEFFESSEPSGALARMEK